MIQRAGSPSGSRFENVRIDHGSGDVAMPQQFLYRSTIRPYLEQVRCKAMAQGMNGYRLCNTGKRDCLLKRTL